MSEDETTGKIPEALIDSLFDRRCLFFIGSGISTEAGLPSSADIIDILTKKLESNGIKSSSKELQKVAQDFCRRNGRPTLLRLVREEIVKKLPNADRTSLKILSGLSPNPKDIVTTNWDPLIEESLGKHNYTPIFEPNAVTRYDESAKMNLFKIHGDIDHDLVITEDDYLEYKKKWRPIVIKMLSLFQERVIVFIGYSTDDHDFLEMYMEVFDMLGTKNLLPRYCVDPNMDELKEKKLRDRGIEPIPMSARDFLLELDQKLQKRLVTYKLPSPKTVPAPIQDFNPFGIFRVEDISDINWINKTFVHPIDFTTIVSSGNVVIEGHRGSGKSMILQYLSYPSVLERKENTNYVGFYVKLQNSFVDSIKRRDMDTEEWKEFFLHYFNLILGESILITIRDLLTENKISPINEKDFVKRALFIFFPDFTFNHQINSIRDLLDVFKRERNKCAKYPRPKDFRLLPHFIYDFIKLVEEYVIEFKDKYFYMLIDEYDKLDDDQQRVVNLYIADRGAPLRYRVSLKIAVKLFEMSYVTIDEKMLEHEDDYQWVPLDRFSKEQEGLFIEKLKEIGNTRLNVYGYKNKLAEILPSGGLGFEENDYSGLENILALSSFLVRDFLELAKDMLYYAFPWMTFEKRDIIPEIGPSIQNLVIKAHSNILYTTRIDEIPGKIGNTERKYPARLLIEKMGVIFQTILLGSKSAEKRTVSSFQLRDETGLTETAKTALDDCRSAGVLQVPFTTRAPQDYARHAPHRKYEFHRLLCPQFRLSLARRWPREIDAKQFNKIFENPDEAVKEISSYFLENLLIDEIVELADSTVDLIELKNIYNNIRQQPHERKALFKKGGPTEIERTLEGYSLKVGKEAILCKSAEEAEYLKVFVDVGMDEVAIPKDSVYLNSILPKIKQLQKRIDNMIKERVEEFPLLRNKKDTLTAKIWAVFLETTK